MEFIYETHMHTAEASACAGSTGAEQARAYHARGYAGIIVTDHFINGNSAFSYDLPWHDWVDLFVTGYIAAKETGDALGLDVFFGWEYKIRGPEFLTYGLGYKFLLAHPELKKMSIEDYSALVRENGGYLAQAHPYRVASYIRNPGAVEAALIDGVEVYNAANTPEENALAESFAREHGLPMQAGSDSHHIKNRLMSGIILRKRARSIFDIIEAIRTGEARIIRE